MSGCPFKKNLSINEPTVNASNHQWRPEQLDLSILRPSSVACDPRGPEFKYSDKFAELNLDELADDVDRVISTSQVSNRRDKKKLESRERLKARQQHVYTGASTLCE